MTALEQKTNLAASGIRRERPATMSNLGVQPQRILLLNMGLGLRACCDCTRCASGLENWQQLQSSLQWLCAYYCFLGGYATTVFRSAVKEAIHLAAWKALGPFFAQSEPLVEICPL